MRAETVALTTDPDRVLAGRPSARGRPRRRALGAGTRVPLRRVIAAAAAVTLLAACSGGGNGAASPGSTAAASASPGHSAAARRHHKVPRPPDIAAVSTHGALVLLNPVSGAVTKTLVPSGVVGDEISASPDGATIYYTTHTADCTDEIRSVSTAGGGSITIAFGLLPAVSPDGTKLAFAREPAESPGCVPSAADLTAQYRVVIHTLSSGAEKVLTMAPADQSSGLPAPISHVSWGPDNTQLAVSISSVEDNEGWNVVIVNTGEASYYEAGPGTTPVPVTGSPKARDSYYREGVFLPNGNLFVSRACCGGVPIKNTSRLMWEVNAAGVLTHQVALGYASLEHTSLAANRSGNWLLYLAGHDLYVSKDGAMPRTLTTGLIAAAWR
jgi:WD40-like Beta Propeller Repeat